MAYLKRLKAPPDPDLITHREKEQLLQRFNPHAGEVFIYGQPVGWEEVDEIEIVKAPVVNGPAGWLVRMFANTADRYHVGIYLGREEAVLPNVPEKTARYIAQTIAYYAPGPVRYKGPADLVPLTSA